MPNAGAFFKTGVAWIAYGLNLCTNNQQSLRLLLYHHFGNWSRGSVQSAASLSLFNSKKCVRLLQRQYLQTSSHLCYLQLCWHLPNPSCLLTYIFLTLTTNIASRSSITQRNISLLKYEAFSFNQLLPNYHIQLSWLSKWSSQSA